jgi:hypothetical protein
MKRNTLFLAPEVLQQPLTRLLSGLMCARKELGLPRLWSYRHQYRSGART